MATPAFTRSEVPGGCQLHSWALTTADHTGAAAEIPGAADRSVQFVGGAGWGGATAGLEGSNDGATWSALHDPADGAAIDATTDTNFAAVLENPRYIRPRLTTVGAGATVTAYLLSRTT